jgi:hypothetical protein
LKSNSEFLVKHGVPIDLVSTLAIDISVIVVIGVVGIVAVVWLVQADTTIVGKVSSNIDKEFGYLGFSENLKRLSEVMKTRLTRIDEESNWTDHAFTALDAEIEQLGARPDSVWTA